MTRNALNARNPKRTATATPAQENTVTSPKRRRVTHNKVGAASTAAPIPEPAQPLDSIPVVAVMPPRNKGGRPKGSKNRAASSAAPSMPTEERILTIPTPVTNITATTPDGNISFVAQPSLSKQSMPIRYLKTIAESGMLNLNPPYQRPAGAWTGQRRRALIYSLIAGIDVPKLYFRSMVTNDNRTVMEVVDGKQRITTVFDFINGLFRTGSGDMFATTEIANKKFDKLPVEIQERILNYAMDVVVLKDYDEGLISQMFLLLQQGVGTTAQENRNAHVGMVRDTVVALAEHEVFGYLSFTNLRLGYQQISSQVLAMALNDGAATNISKTSLDAIYSRYSNHEYSQMVDAASENTIRLFDYIQNGILALMGNEAEANEEALADTPDESYISRRALSKGGFITLCAYLFRIMPEFDVDASAPEILDLYFDAYDMVMDKEDRDYTAYRSLTGSGSDGVSSITGRVNIIYNRTIESLKEDFDAKPANQMFTVSNLKMSIPETEDKEPELVN